MKNSERYNFADFTYNNYARLIQLAKNGYKFRTFTNFEKNEKFIIWRHDIDFSPHSAVELAKIEAQQKIQTTYCLNLHSDFFNFLDKKTTKCIYKILEYGHCIGLHFDNYYYDIQSVESLEKYLLLEKKILEKLFDVKVEMFSFHNPISINASFENFEYCGMINSYAKYFREQVGYCSDSNGYWRFRRLEDVLKKKEEGSLQVLTHPVWWTNEIESPKQKIWRCLELRMNDSKKLYKKRIKEFNREIIDW